MTASQSPLYALYIQATRQRNAHADVQRKQWIVFPPMPTEEAIKRLLPGKAEMNLMFTREQSAPTNRVKWRHEFIGVDLMKKELPLKLAVLERENLNYEPAFQWKISPPITAQVTFDELAELITDPKTPYDVLRRFEKVARAKHHIAI